MAHIEVSRWLKLQILEQIGKYLEKHIDHQVIIYLDENDYPMHVQDLGTAIPGDQCRHVVEPVHERIDKLMVSARIEFRDDHNDCLAYLELSSIRVGHEINWTVPDKSKLEYFT